MSPMSENWNFFVPNFLTHNTAENKRFELKSQHCDECYIHCVPKKHPRHFQLYLEKQLSNFNNFWHKYS